jgi:hypothetical protein
MSTLFLKLGGGTYEECKAFMLLNTGRTEFYPHEIEPWMKELEGYYDPEGYEEEEVEYAHASGEEMDPVLNVIGDDDKMTAVISMLVGGKMRRDDAVAIIAKMRGMTQDQVSEILRSEDL